MRLLGAVGFGLLVSLLLALLLAFIIVGVQGMLRERREWNAYAGVHCKVIGHMDGDIGVGNTFGGNGQVGVAVIATPDKIGYLCDNGITYWKER